MRIEYQKILGVNHRFFEEAMAIYKKAFPSNERQTIATLIKRISNNQSQLWVGIVEDEVVVMALLWEFEESLFVLLDYLAVKEGFRGQQFGGAMFQQLVKKVQQQQRFLALEVEHGQYGQNKPERQKRINFYLQNGAYLLANVPYILPSLDGTSPTEMHLMVAPQPPMLAPESIKDLIQKLYLQVYEKKTTDPVLLSLLEKVPTSIELTNTQTL